MTVTSGRAETPPPNDGDENFSREIDDWHTFLRCEGRRSPPARGPAAASCWLEPKGLILRKDLPCPRTWRRSRRTLSNAPIDWARAYAAIGMRVFPSARTKSRSRAWRQRRHD